MIYGRLDFSQSGRLTEDVKGEFVRVRFVLFIETISNSDSSVMFGGSEMCIASSIARQHFDWCQLCLGGPERSTQTNPREILYFQKAEIIVVNYKIFNIDQNNGIIFKEK